LETDASRDPRWASRVETDPLPRHALTSAPVIPAEQAGLRPASESRNPVTEAVAAYTPAVDYWVPARASPVELGSLGRDDGHS